MKKPEKFHEHFADVWLYDTKEMDAYVEWLEQARDEAKVLLCLRDGTMVKTGEHTWTDSLILKSNWLSKYASEKVEGGGG